jgi:hypothetical protein
MVGRALEEEDMMARGSVGVCGCNYGREALITMKEKMERGCLILGIPRLHVIWRSNWSRDYIQIVYNLCVKVYL